MSDTDIQWYHLRWDIVAHEIKGTHHHFTKRQMNPFISKVAIKIRSKLIIAVGNLSSHFFINQ